MTYTIEVTRKVFDDDLGASIEVRPDQDGLGLVNIIGGEDFGGDICLCPEMAILLADAIKATANELLKETA